MATVSKSTVTIATNSMAIFTMTNVNITMDTLGIVTQQRHYDKLCITRKCLEFSVSLKTS